MLHGHIMPESIDQWYIVRSHNAAVHIVSSPRVSSANAAAAANDIDDQRQQQTTIQLMNNSNSITKKHVELTMKGVRTVSHNTISTNRNDNTHHSLMLTSKCDVNRIRRNNSRSRYSLAEYRLNLLLYRKE